MESPHSTGNNPLLLHEEHVVNVLTIFIREEIRRTGLSKAIIGLSGGVDSALSTYLAVRAVGAENVHVLLMPYRTSSPESLSDAEAVVNDLGISSEIFDISDTADTFFRSMQSATDNAALMRLRRGNAMARIRMIALYDRSQSTGALVVGTSNKTESLLGYTTIFGDNASAINPLGDLYKTQVWQLSQYLGVPEQIISKPPSADLWPGQTDESELGVSYREVDELLFNMIDLRERDDALIKRGYKPDYIQRIRDTVRRSQYKRQLPLIAKISSRTINADFRYPRDWGT